MPWSTTICMKLTTILCNILFLDSTRHEDIPPSRSVRAVRCAPRALLVEPLKVRHWGPTLGDLLHCTLHLNKQHPVQSYLHEPADHTCVSQGEIQVCYSNHETGQSFVSLVAPVAQLHSSGQRHTAVCSPKHHAHQFVVHRRWTLGLVTCAWLTAKELSVKATWTSAIHRTSTTAIHRYTY